MNKAIQIDDEYYLDIWGKSSILLHKCNFKALGAIHRGLCDRCNETTPDNILNIVKLYSIDKNLRFYFTADPF
jgi:hypothetical protein